MFILKQKGAAAMGRKKASLRLWAVAFWLVVWQLAAMASCNPCDESEG